MSKLLLKKGTAIRKDWSLKLEKQKLAGDNIRFLKPSSPTFKEKSKNANNKIKIALYSHDTMGLGHKRRNTLIAKTLADSYLPTDILTITGIQEASDFPKRSGLDCLSLPALYKTAEGLYQSRYLNISLQKIIKLRGRIIKAALKAFDPDILIVDKVPRGAVKELNPTLKYLRNLGKTHCILGLRDVLDEPAAVRREWEKAGNDRAIRKYYDTIWVYGDPQVYDLAREYQFAADIAAKIRYTGYFDRRVELKYATAQSDRVLRDLSNLPEEFVLCLVGGGQDGNLLAETFARSEFPAETYGVILTGPFMSAAMKTKLHEWEIDNPHLIVREFIAEPTLLIDRASRVISMGGYNSIYELLSFEKKALIVPRVKPRLEQILRAENLQRLGLVDLLHPDDLTPQALTAWLAKEIKPVKARDLIDFKGLDRLPHLIEDLIAQSSPSILKAL